MIFEPQVIYVCVEEEDTVCVDAEVTVTHGTVDYYTGEYEVDPTFSSQVLETKDKFMSDDVTINAIAVQSVTNPSGGNTIFIGMI